jgi:hypothetical protein
MSRGCLCLTLGIECWCTRTGPPLGPRSRWPGYAPHGTLAAARRHYRQEGPGWQCGTCRAAERADNAARGRARRAAAAELEAAAQAARRAELAAALPSCNQYHRAAA